MPINQPIDLIIWDWNGTLLDDTEICIEAMNRLLKVRNLPLLEKKKYIQIFTFPVQEYYRLAGFDFEKEPFEKPAMEFMDEYFRLLPTAGLTENAVELLQYFNRVGKRQVILSAMEQQSLEKSVKELGVTGYFASINGANDHYARGKVKQGKMFIQQLKSNTQKALLIGDTIHDKQVADEIGCQCLLVAHGHQSFERLSSNGTHVVRDFNAVFEIFRKP